MSSGEVGEHAREIGRHVMLAIHDTGRDTGDENGERLGPGLATVYGVVHQSGGSIGVERAR